MSGYRDPVDNALDALRTETWSAAPLTPEQETLLMQQADKQMKQRGPQSYRALIAAIAVIAVGGAAFAATDGVSRLRTWLFDVEVAPGTNAKILVHDGQTGTMIIEDDDGTITEIEARADELEDGGTRAKVTVRKSDDIGETEDVHEVIRVRGEGPVETVSLDVLKDAELLTDWFDETERVVEVYAVSKKGDKKAQLYVVTEGFEPLPDRRIIASPKVLALFLETKPVVTVDKAGTIGIEFDAGDEVAMFKFATGMTTSDDTPDVDGPIEIESADGEMRIRVKSSD